MSDFLFKNPTPFPFLRGTRRVARHHNHSPLLQVTVNAIAQTDRPMGNLFALKIVTKVLILLSVAAASTKHVQSVCVPTAEPFRHLNVAIVAQHKILIVIWMRCICGAWKQRHISSVGFANAKVRRCKTFNL